MDGSFDCPHRCLLEGLLCICKNLNQIVGVHIDKYSHSRDLGFLKDLLPVCHRFTSLDTQYER